MKVRRSRVSKMARMTLLTARRRGSRTSVQLQFRDEAVEGEDHNEDEEGTLGRLRRRGMMISGNEVASPS